jgi:hypothetical protein
MCAMQEKVGGEGDMMITHKHLAAEGCRKQDAVVQQDLEQQVALDQEHLVRTQNRTQNGREKNDVILKTVTTHLETQPPCVTTLGQNTARRHGQRRSTAWRCGSEELPEGSSRESKLSL